MIVSCWLVLSLPPLSSLRRTPLVFFCFLCFGVRFTVAGVADIALTACSRESSATCSTARFSPLAAFSLAASSALTAGGGNGTETAVATASSPLLRSDGSPRSRSKLSSASMCTAFLALLGGRDATSSVRSSSASAMIRSMTDRISAMVRRSAPPCSSRWRMLMGAQWLMNGTCCRGRCCCFAFFAFFFPPATARSSSPFPTFSLFTSLLWLSLSHDSTLIFG
mmetsp:Transcript_37514/g.80977  ORF Transcript_37514/g.80977 Transcript_37514/m.80977 type:complete len:223 (-) Transcript_37514:925-1593(-)